MKIIFFGSDHFSLAALEACAQSGHEIALVVTTPPQKKGRGLELSPTPVQLEAEKRGFPFIAPADLKAAETLSRVSDAKPDFYVVSSYGKYIPSTYLGLPSTASFNVHPSLLPLYRGSSPIQTTLLNGDAETGVSIIEVDKKLDAGGIYVQVRVPVAPRDDYPSLANRLAELSREILKDLLVRFASERPPAAPQDESRATLTRKLEKDDGQLAWSDDAAVFDRKVRALKPWPGTYVHFEGMRLSILEAEAVPYTGPASHGTVLEAANDGSLTVAAGRGAVKILKVQLAGRNAVSARDFANGRRIKAGFVFGSQP